MTTDSSNRNIFFRTLVRSIAAIVVLASNTAEAQCGGWVGPTPFELPGIGGQVLTSVHFDPDGDGPRSEELIVGGILSSAGGLPAHYVATWDGTSWKALDTGMPTGEAQVKALCVYHSKLYAGGSFYFSDGFATLVEWNGTSWNRMDPMPSSYVHSLAVYNDELIVGGSFTSVGAMYASYIAAWNGTTWHQVGGLPDDVDHLLAHDGLLYAAGYFQDSNAKLKFWDGTNWTGIPASGDSTIGALGVFEGNVIFSSGDTVKKLIGLNAVSVGAPFDAGIHALSVVNGALYAGGNFTKAGALIANRLARWDGSQWNPIGAGLGPAGTYVEVIDSYQGQMIVGGTFTEAGGLKVSSIARTDGTVWVPGALSANDSVFAIQALDEAVVFGGAFTQLNQRSLSRLAQWSGNEWTAMPGSANKSIGALGVSGNTLFAGSRSGALFPYLQTWNGSSWSPIASDLVASGPPSNQVSAICAFGAKTIVGGRFNGAGSVTTPNIAAWNGLAWEPLGSGFNNTVQAIAVFHGELVAGGFFTQSGLVPMNYLARWTPSGWQAFPTTTNGPVNALVVADDSLYVGGNFGTAGGAVVRYVARWDGNAWSSLGTGVGGFVNAMVMYNGSLIVGGRFTTAGSVAASMIARWDGAAWSPLGLGLQTTNSGNQVYSLATFGSELLVGGSFISAGGQPGTNLARWSDTGIPWITNQPVSQSIVKESTLVLNSAVADNYAAVSYHWQRNNINIANGPGGASSGGGTVFGASGVLDSPTRASSVTLSISGAQSSDTGTYTIVLITSCGSASSAAADIVVRGCPGDLNGDNLVSDTDFQIFVPAYNTLDCADSSMPQGCPADLNRDGLVDDADFEVFVIAYNALNCP